MKVEVPTPECQSSFYSVAQGAEPFLPKTLKGENEDEVSL